MASAHRLAPCVPLSEDSPDHPTPCSFPPCTPSLPSALAMPLTCFILVTALTTTRNHVLTCVPNWNINFRRAFNREQVPRTAPGTWRGLPEV